MNIKNAFTNHELNLKLGFASNGIIISRPVCANVPDHLGIGELFKSKMQDIKVETTLSLTKEEALRLVTETIDLLYESE